MAEKQKNKECDNCAEKFVCFTGGDAVCPIVDGKDIRGAYIFYNNVALYDYKHSFRIRSSDLLKLVRKANYKTSRKRGLIYLEVID